MKQQRDQHQTYIQILVKHSNYDQRTKLSQPCKLKPDLLPLRHLQVIAQLRFVSAKEAKFAIHRKQ